MPEPHHPDAPADPAPLPVEIAAGEVTLHGDLHTPASFRGAVLFAHGSGSSRHSPRNQYVARALHSAGFATLLFDLLTEAEEAYERNTGELRFDIPLLARRLVDATHWLRARPEYREIPLGYFGASTGAAAALVAAAQARDIAAVVSRGGRPDLAGGALAQVRAPVLLLVGGNDRVVLDLNRRALAHLTCEKQLDIIPGATHLFEEPGALEQVAAKASTWFQRFFA